MDGCSPSWPPSSSCTRLAGFVLYSVLSIFIAVGSLLPNQISYNRVGHLPLSFFISAFTSFLLLGQSAAYIFFAFYVHEYTHILAAFCVVRAAFWLLWLVTFIRSRSLQQLPLSLAISLSLTSLLQLVPLSAWQEYYPPSAHRNGEVAFYISETIFVFVVFTFTLVISSLRSDSPSAWSKMSRKLSIILPFIWPRKSIGLQLRVAFCLFLLLLGRIINVAVPLYNKWIVDALANPPTFHYSLIFISSALKFLQGSGAMGSFLNTLRTYIWVPIQQYTTREIEVELFEHLHRLSLRWHLSRKTGLVLRVMDRGTNSINQILNYLLFNIVPTIADIAIAVVFFFSTFDAYFGVIVLITMVLYLGMTIFITEWRTKFSREMNEKDNASSAIGTDSLLNYETVKYYGNEKYEVDRFRQAILAFQKAEWKVNASLAILNYAQNGVIAAGMTGGSLLVVYLMQVDNRLTVGDYVLFTTYMFQLYTPLNFFGTIYRVIQKSFIDMENMFELMAEEVEVQDAPDAVEYQPSEGQIAVSDLSFEYNAGKTVLDGINFQVKSGQSIALVGPSGSGKSTMIRLLFRLFESGSGRIEFDGQDVKKLSLASLRGQIGIVPQDTVLFNDTIRYNIRFGRPSATDEEIEDAARAAMIHDKIISLPHGYETVVGERGLKLSGGEKQRVAIARTILKQPQFIFLDEATSALDTHTERAIQRCLLELCATRTSVVVAHRLSTIVHSDCILVLDKGIVVETGTHANLLAAEGVYARMWASQMAEARPGNGSALPTPPDVPANPEESEA